MYSRSVRRERKFLQYKILEMASIIDSLRFYTAPHYKSARIASSSPACYLRVAFMNDIHASCEKNWYNCYKLHSHCRRSNDLGHTFIKFTSMCTIVTKQPEYTCVWEHTKHTYLSFYMASQDRQININIMVLKMTTLVTEKCHTHLSSSNCE